MTYRRLADENYNTSNTCKQFINSVCLELRKSIDQNKKEGLGEILTSASSEKRQCQLKLELLVPDSNTERIFSTINNLTKVLTSSMSIKMVEDILRAKYVTEFEVEEVERSENMRVANEDVNALDIFSQIK